LGRTGTVSSQWSRRISWRGRLHGTKSVWRIE